MQTQLTQFYMTNSISRASSTMAKCIKTFENSKNQESKTAQKAMNWIEKI